MSGPQLASHVEESIARWGLARSQFTALYWYNPERGRQIGMDERVLDSPHVRDLAPFRAGSWYTDGVSWRIEWRDSSPEQAGSGADGDAPRMSILGNGSISIMRRGQGLTVSDGDSSLGMCMPPGYVLAVEGRLLTSMLRGSGCEVASDGEFWVAVCHQDGEDTVRTVWLDPQRGWMPIRWEVLTPRGLIQTQLEYAEIDGHWVPQEGLRTLSSRSGDEITMVLGREQVKFAEWRFGETLSDANIELQVEVGTQIAEVGGGRRKFPLGSTHSEILEGQLGLGGWQPVAADLPDADGAPRTSRSTFLVSPSIVQHSIEAWWINFQRLREDYDQNGLCGMFAAYVLLRSREGGVDFADLREELARREGPTIRDLLTCLSTRGQEFRLVSAEWSDLLLAERPFALVLEDTDAKPGHQLHVVAAYAERSTRGEPTGRIVLYDFPGGVASADSRDLARVWRGEVVASVFDLGKFGGGGRGSTLILVICLVAMVGAALILHLLRRRGAGRLPS